MCKGPVPFPEILIRFDGLVLLSVMSTERSMPGKICIGNGRRLAGGVVRPVISVLKRSVRSDLSMIYAGCAKAGHEIFDPGRPLI